jgi:hypothetical protein
MKVLALYSAVFFSSITLFVNIIHASDLGFIERKGIQLPIEDFLIALEAENKVLIYIFPFKLSKEERSIAILDPYLFTLKVNAQSRYPKKWATWTPTGYFIINLNKKGGVRTYAIGENWILERGENFSSSTGNGNGLEIKKAELKQGGVVSIKSSGENKEKEIKWLLDLAGTIEVTR